MHCNCCDRELSEKEIIWNEDLGTWELCTTCLDVAIDAANSNGFNVGDEEYEYAVDDEYDDFVPYDELDHHVFSHEGYGG